MSSDCVCQALPPAAFHKSCSHRAVMKVLFCLSLHRSDEKPQLGAPLNIGNSCTFKSFRTNNYKLHFMESPSGVKVCYVVHMPCHILYIPLTPTLNPCNADCVQYRSERGQSSRLPCIHIQQPVRRICNEEPFIRPRTAFQVTSQRL